MAERKPEKVVDGVPVYDGVLTDTPVIGEDGVPHPDPIADDDSLWWSQPDSPA